MRPKYNVDLVTAEFQYARQNGNERRVTLEDLDMQRPVYRVGKSRLFRDLVLETRLKRLLRTVTLLQEN